MFGLSGRQLLILLVFVVLLFAAVQYVPTYFAAYQFNDYIRQEVKYAGTSRRTPETIRTGILQEANDLGISITKNDVRITQRGPSFTLEVEYRWPIDLKVYRHELIFHPSATGEVFENAPH